MLSAAKDYVEMITMILLFTHCQITMDWAFFTIIIMIFRIAFTQVVHFFIWHWVSKQDQNLKRKYWRILQTQMTIKMLSLRRTSCKYKIMRVRDKHVA